ncbi:MAG: hypothetical protein GVY16_01090 [Planctomycetes bacterium]|jgi:hypothetical protein|nr:hypothetical protein [Phycisphaerae bacterium]NBB94321.1 hypothetical protein [Planctomycetota bacterium]
MSMWRIALIVAYFFAAVAIAGDDKPPLRPDEPTAGEPRPGRLTAVITPAEQVKAVRVVSRQTGKEYRPASFDKATGEARFADLPGDANYDVCIATTDGREIEGVDLAFVDARLQRLADARRKELDLPARKPGRFTTDDVEAITKFVAGWEDFMDTRRMLYLRGHGDRATVLVELMRLKEFHASGRGENQQMVWRIELWYMRNAGGGWERLPNVERTLRRFRGLPADWRMIHVEYTPALTATIDAGGKAEPLRFDIPVRPDPATSRPAETEPALDTQPRILGLDDDSPPET